MSPRLAPCPSCSRHLLSSSTTCPHCGVEITHRGAIPKTASAALLGLALAGCVDGKDTGDQPEYGVADTSHTGETGDTADTADTGDQSDYGVPDTGETGNQADYGVPDTGETGASTETGDTGLGPQPEYGVPDTGQSWEPDYGVPDTGGVSPAPEDTGKPDPDTGAVVEVPDTGKPDPDTGGGAVPLPGTDTGKPEPDTGKAEPAPDTGGGPVPLYGVPDTGS